MVIATIAKPPLPPRVNTREGPTRDLLQVPGLQENIRQSPKEQKEKPAIPPRRLSNNAVTTETNAQVPTRPVSAPNYPKQQPKHEKPTLPPRKSDPETKPSVPSRYLAKDINIRLETQWYKNVNNIELFPKELQENTHQIMFKSDGHEVTTLVAVQYKDMSRSVFHLRWKANHPEKCEVTQVHKMPKKYSKDELVKISKVFGSKILSYCRMHAGMKVAKDNAGFVKEALKFAECSLPNEHTTLDYGYLIVSTGIDIDTPRPGDILVWKEHLGIIFKVEKDEILVYVNEERVKELTVSLKSMKKYSVYRPMDKEWIKPLINELQ